MDRAPQQSYEDGLRQDFVDLLVVPNTVNTEKINCIEFKIRQIGNLACLLLVYLLFCILY